MATTPTDRVSRSDALEAISAHGSIRKAAAATGVPKSTLHRLVSSPGDPGTAWVPAETLPVTAQDQPSIEDEAQYPHYTGAPDDPERVPDFVDRLDDPMFLRALHRYLSVVATGSTPAAAHHAATIIDPYFMLTDADTDELHAAVEKFTGAEAETAVFAQYAPSWVSTTARDFWYDDTSVNELLDALTAVRTDGWIAGINAGLTAHGRSPIDGITDPNLQRRIQLDAAEGANAAARTWNADATAAVWKAWEGGIGGLPAGQQEAALRQAMVDWRDGRVEWKAEQLSNDQATSGLFDATKEFQAQNQTGEGGWVEPQDAVCPLCIEAIDAAGPSDPLPVGELMQWDFPLHASCPHGLYITQIDIPDDAQLWDGSEGSVGLSMSGTAEDVAGIDRADPLAAEPDLTRLPDANALVHDAADARDTAARLIERATAAEKPITADMQSIVSSLGGQLSGLDFKLKGAGSMVDKLLGDAATNAALGLPNDTVASIAAKVGDSLRYTMTFDVSNYTADANAAYAAMRDAGYTLVKDSNTWGIPPYWGINTNWVDANGFKFEMQFHTPESFAMKNDVNHKLYEEWRVMPDKTTPHAVELMDQMTANTETLTMPAGAGAVTGGLG